MGAQPTPLTYKDSGVDIDTGNALIERIAPYTQKTKRPEVMGGIGGFGALMSIPSRYKEPVLVSGTDGVGTKLKLAIELGVYDTIGIDLVAMCVNDIIVTGAEPLFFLDYYATGSLELDVAEAVVKGIADGCEQSGASLIGGETAEMPGMYSKSDFDLAGFSVGVVEKSQIIDKSQVQMGDVIIGMASSGPHSNGYSLIRKIIEMNDVSLSQPFEDSTLGKTLLTPTQIYVKPLLNALKQLNLHAIAHITGGGLPENLPRVLPRGCTAEIDLSSWQRPAVFDWLQEMGHIEDFEMLRTFNCGIGMVVVAHPDQAEDIINSFRLNDIRAWPIGTIKPSEDSDTHVNFIN